MMRGIDHVGIAVRGGEIASTTFARLLGQTTPHFEDVLTQSVRVCFLPEDAPNLELLAPADDAGPVARFLERRGEPSRAERVRTD